MKTFEQAVAYLESFLWYNRDVLDWHPTKPPIEHNLAVFSKRIKDRTITICMNNKEIVYIRQSWIDQMDYLQREWYIRNVPFEMLANTLKKIW